MNVQPDAVNDYQRRYIEAKREVSAMQAEREKMLVELENMKRARKEAIIRGGLVDMEGENKLTKRLADLDQALVVMEAKKRNLQKAWQVAQSPESRPATPDPRRKVF